MKDRTDNEETGNIRSRVIFALESYLMLSVKKFTISIKFTRLKFGGIKIRYYLCSANPTL